MAKPKILFIGCVKNRKLEADLCRFGDRSNEKSPNYGDLFFDALDNNTKSNITLVYHNIVHEDLYLKLDEISGVIIGGSEHNLSETNQDDWICKLKELIVNADSKQLPLLGICFGHQIIAETFGGEIRNKKPRELGTVDVHLTPEGEKDPIFRGFQRTFSVLMSHQDILSKRSDQIVTLAYNSFCDHQAIAVGECIRGIQFHPESTKEKILRLTARWYQELEAEGLDMAELKKNLRDTPTVKKVFDNFIDYYIFQKDR